MEDLCVTILGCKCGVYNSITILIKNDILTLEVPYNPKVFAKLNNTLSK